MRALIAAALAVLPLPAFAQDLPSPADREMSTDRPDKTESPYSVPKGRVQIEMDFANYTRDRSADGRVETIGVAPFNVKLGLGDDTDLQFVAAPYIHRTATDPRDGTRTSTEGIGDVTIRLKQNFWGNDGGKTAFALMPYVTLPTSHKGLGADMVEFGLIAPLAIGLSDTIDLGVMTEVDVVGKDDGRGRRVNVVNSATLGFALAKRVGMYTELFTERGDQWVVTGDIGVTYKVTDDMQVDAGVNLGLNSAADDVGVFAGLSRRF